VASRSIGDRCRHVCTGRVAAARFRNEIAKGAWHQSRIFFHLSTFPDIFLKMTETRNKANQSQPGRTLTALDIFAMPESLSPEGEALWEDVMKQVERERKDGQLNCPRDVDL
jgi:hypothetical protein